MKANENSVHKKQRYIIQPYLERIESNPIRKGYELFGDAVGMVAQPSVQDYLRGSGDQHLTVTPEELLRQARSILLYSGYMKGIDEVSVREHLVSAALPSVRNSDGSTDESVINRYYKRQFVEYRFAIEYIDKLLGETWELAQTDNLLESFRVRFLEDQPDAEKFQGQRLWNYLLPTV